MTHGAPSLASKASTRDAPAELAAPEREPISPSLAIRSVPPSNTPAPQEEAPPRPRSWAPSAIVHRGTVSPAEGAVDVNTRPHEHKRRAMVLTFIVLSLFGAFAILRWAAPSEPDRSEAAQVEPSPRAAVRKRARARWLRATRRAKRKAAAKRSARETSEQAPKLTGPF